VRRKTVAASFARFAAHVISKIPPIEFPNLQHCLSVFARNFSGEFMAHPTGYATSWQQASSVKGKETFN
jgi:hypothetical protein